MRNTVELLHKNTEASLHVMFQLEVLIAQLLINIVNVKIHLKTSERLRNITHLSILHTFPAILEISFFLSRFPLTSSETDQHLASTEAILFLFDRMVKGLCVSGTFNRILITPPAES